MGRTGRIEPHATARVLAALLVVAALPMTAYGQASIVGTVKDASGAVLPGVLVEASSPALIEKVRTVPGLFNVRPDKFGLTNDYRTLSSDYGKQIQNYDGINLDVNMRLQALTVQAGLAAEKTTNDSCEIVKQVPELLLVGGVWLPESNCRTVTPFLMNYKGLATYTIPRADVQVSGTYQDLAGAELAANFNAPNAVIAPGLGRPLAGNTPNLPVNLLEPATQYGQRYRQIDLRVGKLFRAAGTRALVAFDLYNALNANPIQTYNNTFVVNGAWLTPTLIEPPRVAKVSVQFDF